MKRAKIGHKLIHDMNDRDMMYVVWLYENENLVQTKEVREYSYEIAQKIAREWENEQTSSI